MRKNYSFWKKSKSIFIFFLIEIIRSLLYLTAQLKICDTAGEEKFRTVTRQFYYDSLGDLIVDCIDNKSSFDKVNSWIIDLKNNAPEDSVIMIVGNKSDLNYNRKVESEEAKNFAEKN